MRMIMYLGMVGSSILLAVAALGAPPLLGLARPALERVAEVRRLVHPPDLQRDPVAERGALHPLDRLLLGLGLDDPEARDHLLALGEGAVGHDALLPVERETG